MKERMTTEERKKCGNSNRTELYHLNRISCCLSIFCMKHDCVFVLCTHLAIGFHSNAISEEFKCKTKKNTAKELKSRRKRNEMKRKKCISKSVFDLIYAKSINMVTKYQHQQIQRRSLLHLCVLQYLSCHASQSE